MLLINKYVIKLWLWCGREILKELTMKEADRLFGKFEEAYEKSKLPMDNNPTDINKLLWEVMTFETPTKE